LETGNKQIRFSAALGQLLDLRIFRADLATEKFNLPFKASNITVIGGANSRVRSRLFGSVLGSWRRLFVFVFHGANVRV